MKFKKIPEAIDKENAFFLPTNGRFWSSSARFHDKMLRRAKTRDPGKQAMIYLKLRGMLRPGTHELCTAEPNKFVLLYALF